MNAKELKSHFLKTIALSLSLCLGMIAQVLAAVPTIRSFSPSQGPAGTPVQLRGEGFESTSDVLIGTKESVFQVLSDQLILATVPREASTGVIQIVTAEGIAVSSTPFVGAPFIEELNPEFGAPGEPVILFGRNLGNATSVRFGDEAASFLVLGETQLRALVPDMTGLTSIEVTTPVGVVTSEIPFEATGRVPFVREFMPEFAPPGSTVTVNGKNFTGTTEFRFGSRSAPFVVTADTQIQLTIPSDAPSGPVSLRNGFGESTSRIDFLVLGTSPFVEEIIPELASPGERVTLEGINFTGTSAIFFGDAAAEFTVTADTQIQVIIPEAATSGPPRFESINGNSVSDLVFTVNTLAPIIEEFEPLAVRTGQLVRINGLNFTAVTSVLVGEEAVEFAVVADNQISLTAPLTPVTAKITLTSPGGITSSDGPLVVTGPEPRISGLDPGAGLPGDLIQIEGGNFSTTTNVWFGSLSAEFSIIADNQLQAVVPNEAVTSTVSVANPGGRAESPELFYLPARISSIDPAIATPGDTVTLTGANFTGASEIQFGSIVGSILAITPNSLEAQVPNDARSGPVAVTNPAGITGSLEEFGLRPRLDSFFPVAGPIGAEVILSGRGFTEVSSVQFGTVPAAFEIRSSTEIAARVPINSPSSTIRIASPIASSTSLEPFSVIESADLQLTSELVTENLVLQEPYVIRLTVTSQGPSVLANGRLSIALPPGSFVQSRTNSHGGCEFAAGTVECTLVNLAPGQAAQIVIQVLPTVFGNFNSDIQLTSPLFDPTPGDYSQSLPLEITGPTPDLRISKNEEDERFLSWPKAAFDYKLETTDTLSAPITWTFVETQPIDLNDRWAIQLPSMGQGFYRLRNQSASSSPLSE